MINYSRNAINNLSEVNFIGLGVKSHIKKNRKKLQEIFVEPKFVANNEVSHKVIAKNLEKNTSTRFFSNKNKYPLVLNYNKLFSSGCNFVVLGNPGAGKSMLCKSIICSILERSTKDFDDKGIFSFVPFRIELRKYNQHKKENKTGLIKYLISILEVEYDMSNVPEKRLKGLFLNHPSIIFFDGLDEIFNVEEKIDVKNDIEMFALAYSNARIVVTSRIIGYEEVKLKSSLFIDLSIIPFDEKQITKYVNQWYEEEEADETLRKNDVEGFLSHMHEIDVELITNPLLLSLIVILYRNNLKIPESKLEIYQSCTKTLVDKWDGSKELTLTLDENLSKRKESLFADLAYWHYTQAGLENSTITNARVQETVAETIVNKLGITDDHIEGMKLAEKFLEYAQKRSLYFDNNFTHKTFLEYFTAFWIYSNVEKKHKVPERNDIVSKYISSNFWYVVLELLLNMIDDNQADNEILDSLLTEQLSKKDAYPFLLIVAPTIKNVSPKILDAIYLNALRFEFNAVYESKARLEVVANNKHFARRRDIFEYFARNFAANNINGRFTKAFESLYQEIFNEPDKSLLYFVMYDELLLSSYEAPKVLCKQVSEILKQGEAYKALIKDDAYLCLLDIYCETYVLKSGSIDRMLEAIKRFGNKVFFKTFEGMFSHFGLSYFGLFFNHYLRPSLVGAFKETLMKLEGAGVSRNVLFTQLKNQDYLAYSVPPDAAVKLLPLISTDNSAITNGVITGVFYQAVMNNETHIRNKKQPISKHVDEAIASHEFNWLHKLFLTQNRKEAFNLIEIEFGLGNSNKKLVK